VPIQNQVVVSPSRTPTARTLKDTRADQMLSSPASFLKRGEL
jgi:hypothetical protein